MGLNPRIKTIELGIEELTEYRIYPLSMADEFRISEIISSVAKDVVALEEKGESSDTQLVQLGLNVIKDNIGTILEMTTKKDNRPKLTEIDNVQFSELTELIFEINFEGTIKNFQGLVKKIKSMFPQTRPSQPSLDFPVTG